MVPAYTGCLLGRLLGYFESDLIWSGLVRSGLYLSWPVLSLLFICRLQREKNETDRKSAQQRPVGLMHGRKDEAQLGLFLKMLWMDIFIRGALMLARNRWQAS